MFQVPNLKNKAGVFFALFCVMCIFISIFAYRTLLSPRWVREFSLDIAARAEILSYSPDTTAFSAIRNRKEPDSPYICLEKFTEFNWDRVYFVSGVHQLPNHLKVKNWLDNSYENLYDLLARDSRYQFIIFERNGNIIDSEHYFSMWADFSEITKMSGYLPLEAVFLAESDGVRYTLKATQNVKSNYCSSKTGLDH
ncbi:MAG: hypothetical protein CMM25_07505 [Rhodospirillaceae bacterium]|nr:hypothetical protein [Rhodospirillaceae bacterium]